MSLDNSAIKEPDSPLSGIFKDVYKPDILQCLANLSNDEVFTPPDIVNNMLDLLPSEIWENPNLKFLDPACKTGVFLREITKRLIDGLANKIPDLQERIDHIVHNMVFGIAITELTGLISRRSLYCSRNANSKYSVSKFKSSYGNIIFTPQKHTWENGKCKFCGANQNEYQRDDGLESHAYQFIHTLKPEEIFNMKFDVIISNPPYQISDGGNGASAKPIYQYFVQQAKKLNPRYIVMIIPARWYAGGKGLDEFRREMLHDKKIRNLADFKNSADCFNGVNIAGGICYFLRDEKYSGKCLIQNLTGNKPSQQEKRALDEFPIFIRDNEAIHIVRKVLSHKESVLSNIVFSRNAFSLSSSIRGHCEKQAGDVELISSNGISFINRANISDNKNILEKFKVVITYAMSGGNKPSSDGKYQIVSSLLVLPPNTACTETYLVLNTFHKKEEAENMVSYIKTTFFRFLLLQSLTSIHITKTCFTFVPMQDFSKPWSDEELYKKYGITEDEQKFIESMIRPME